MNEIICQYFVESDHQYAAGWKERSIFAAPRVVPEARKEIQGSQKVAIVAREETKVAQRATQVTPNAHQPDFYLARLHGRIGVV